MIVHDRQRLTRRMYACNVLLLVYCADCWLAGFDVVLCPCAVYATAAVLHCCFSYPLAVTRVEESGVPLLMCCVHLLLPLLLKCSAAAATPLL
jgi:hypothetical protein